LPGFFTSLGPAGCCFVVRASLQHPLSLPPSAQVWDLVQANPKAHCLPSATAHINQDTFQAKSWGAGAEAQLLVETTSDPIQLVMRKLS